MCGSRIVSSGSSCTVEVVVTESRRYEWLAAVGAWTLRLCQALLLHATRQNPTRKKIHCQSKFIPRPNVLVIPASQWTSGYPFTRTFHQIQRPFHGTLTKIPVDDLEEPLGELHPRTFSGRIPSQTGKRLTSLVARNSERPRTCS